MKSVRFKHFLAKRKELMIIAVICGFLIMIYILLKTKQDFITEVYEYNIGNSELYSALMGTIIGGAISLISSIWVSNRQIKIAAEIKRKEEIYKPLYNEMLVLEQVMFNPDIYFHKIYFSKNYKVEAPNYLEWNKIKYSTYYIEIDNVLKNKMDELMNIIIEYNDMYSKSTFELENILRKHLDSSRPKIKFIGLLLQKTFTEGKFNFFEDFVTTAVDIDNIDWHQEKVEEIYQEISSNILLSSTKEKYILIKKEHLEIINLLAIIIETIHIKYER